MTNPPPPGPPPGWDPQQGTPDPGQQGPPPGWDPTGPTQQVPPGWDATGPTQQVPPGWDATGPTQQVPPGWNPQGPPPGSGQQGPPLGPGQPASPPGWNPPGTPDFGQPASRPKLPLILGAAGVAVLVIAATLFLVLRGGGSPEDAVKDFFEASVDGDCDAAVDLVSADLKKQIGSCDDAANADLFNDPQSQDTELGEVTLKEETDDTATVEATVTISGDSQTSNIGLVKEDGDWKIDSFG
jgi:hypothetical protein